MRNKRLITVVITARPSYSRIKTVLKSINENDKLKLNLVVTGSALLKKYGSTVSYIEDDGFIVNEKIHVVTEEESKGSMSRTTGLLIMELSNLFSKIKPDAVITIADRFETIATSIAASYQNIPLIHIQGGEVSGNIDEKVRHANTKLSDIHLVSTEKSKERVIKLGENPDFVFNTGCPSIDLAKKIKNKKLDFDPFVKYGGVGEKFSINDGYLVVMQHPVTNEVENSNYNIKQTIDSIIELKIPTLWFWPNMDSGTFQTVNEIRKLREKRNLSFIHFFKNMKSYDFLKLLNNSMCIIGNSSVAIRECSYLGVPAVNIGTRQNYRERGKNVIDVNYDSKEITNAILKQVKVEKYSKSNIFGDGNSGLLISKILSQVELSFHKVINY